MIVRWGLEELPNVLAEVGGERPFLIASDRWSHLDLPAAGRWSEVPSDRIPEIAAQAQGADGILAVGGGSAIDTAKAASADSSLPLVSVPTSYSGAEWTAFFGIRSPDRRQVGGGSGARLAGIVPFRHPPAATTFGETTASNPSRPIALHNRFKIAHFKIAHPTLAFQGAVGLSSTHLRSSVPRRPPSGGPPPRPRPMILGGRPRWSSRTCTS